MGDDAEAGIRRGRAAGIGRERVRMMIEAGTEEAVQIYKASMRTNLAYAPVDYGYIPSGLRGRYSSA
jgi:hypothetical protein